jgi:F-box protein 36
VVFGQQILQCTQALCHGNFDYLERLPNDLLLQILAFLELKDVALLAQTTKRFHKVSLGFTNPKVRFLR